MNLRLFEAHANSRSCIRRIGLLYCVVGGDPRVSAGAFFFVTGCTCLGNDPVRYPCAEKPGVQMISPQRNNYLRIFLVFLKNEANISRRSEHDPRSRSIEPSRVCHKRPGGPSPARSIPWTGQPCEFKSRRGAVRLISPAKGATRIGAERQRCPGQRRSFSLSSGTAYGLCSRDP